MEKTLAIVGGGPLGVELAKKMERFANVILIEQNSHFVHTPAMIRAIIDPRILDRALIPYDQLLRRGRFIQEQARNVDHTGVTLSNGEHIKADYVVVATGSGYASPFKPSSGGIEGLRAANERANAELTSAQQIAIVGAGAVGTELAGEIAFAMPDKNVTLITPASSLMPEFPKALGTGLTKKLEIAGVTILFGTRVEELQSMVEPYSGDLVLSSGATLSADLVFPVVGARAASGLLANLPDAQFSTSNRIKTDQWMRPSQYSNVFAAGDVVDAGDAMTIVAITRQVPWLVKMLKAVASGAEIEAQKPYTPWPKAPILVPLGPEKGNSFLVAFTAGNFVTTMMKGKDLFLEKAAKLLEKR